MPTVSVPFDEISAANEKGDVLPGGGCRGGPFRRPTSKGTPAARWAKGGKRMGRSFSPPDLEGNTGGAVGEGWETQLQPRVKGAMFHSDGTMPQRNRRRCRIESGDVPDRQDRSFRPGLLRGTVEFRLGTPHYPVPA